MNLYKKIWLTTFCCLLSVIVFGQTRIKAMSYNLLDYSNTAESENRTPDLKAVLESAQPDLLMVCELKNESASNYLFNNAILPYNSSFDKATFVSSQSTYKGLQQMVFFNTKKLRLDNSTVIVTRARDINHYSFTINTVNANTNPIHLEVFVTHLKASSGDSNRMQRLDAAGNFVSALENIPANSYVIFAGDFNFYTSNEEGYQKILDPNNPIVMVDPINRPCPVFPSDGKNYFDSSNYNSTYFWNNSSFKDIHTQATRVSAGSQGAGGGMDDRFDFILLSKNFTTSSDLFYVQNSYTAIGNNKDCYNRSVNDTRCTGTFSQDLRNHLFSFSDHLPVTLEIETPQNTLATPQYTTQLFFTGSNFVKNKITFQLKTTSPVKKLAIYNTLGQKIKTINLSTISTTNSSYSINVSTLAKGLYLLKVDTAKPVKFIKY